jgi:general secretion pathway protein G
MNRISNISLVRRLTRAKARPGFSLLELMLVLVIIGIVVGAVAISIGGTGERAKIKITTSNLATVASALKEYHLNYSSYPPGLETLRTVKPPYLENAIKDAWDSPLAYEPRPRGSTPFTLVSPGPDKQTGTEDDIAYTIDAPAAP